MWLYLCDAEGRKRRGACRVRTALYIFGRTGLLMGLVGGVRWCSIPWHDK